MANFAPFHLLSAVLFILTSATSTFAQDRKVTVLDQQIRAYLSEKEAAQTHEEWHAIKSPLKQRRIGRFQLTNQSPKALFQSLDKLAPEELMHFYEEIHSPTTPLEFNDRNQLSSKISAYISLKKAVLAMNRPKLTPCRADTARTPQSTLGPSEVLIMDNALGKTVTSASLPQCHVNITFDDGPHAKWTREMLAILAEQNVSANYFVLGKQVKLYPNVTREIAAAGHIVGNHTYSHSNLPKLDPARAAEEVASGFRMLLEVFGEYNPFFRFPYGASTKYLKSYAYQNHWLDFFWTMDTLDWKITDPEKLYLNVLKEIEREKRGVMLFHDIHPQTIAVVPFILSELNEAGYTSVLIVPKEVHDRVPN